MNTRNGASVSVPERQRRAAPLTPLVQTLVYLVSNVIFPAHLSFLDVSVSVLLSKGWARALDAHKTITQDVCHRMRIPKALKMTTLLKYRALDRIMYGFTYDENHRLKDFCTHCLRLPRSTDSFTTKRRARIGNGALTCNLCNECVLHPPLGR